MTDARDAARAQQIARDTKPSEMAAAIQQALSEVRAEKPIMVDRDADMRVELRAWLDLQTITSNTIGDFRRALFVPWDSAWNGWVRDDTAERENKLARPTPARREEQG